MTPVPIVVDAFHLDEDPLSNHKSHIPPSPAGMLSPLYSPGMRSPGPGLRNYAETDVTEESDYFPRRGRSPPAPHRIERLPTDIPLPESSGSGYMDSPTRNTAVEHNAIVSTLISKDEHQSLQHTEDMEQQSIIASLEPRTTAAAEASLAYPSDLAGVGSAYTTSHYEIPRGNLDDEFTTDTTTADERFAPDNSISCDLAGG